MAVAVIAAVVAVAAVAFAAAAVVAAVADKCHQLLRTAIVPIDMRH